MFPKLQSLSGDSRLVVPLFFYHPEKGLWYGAFSLEVDWLAEPQIVFAPLEQIRTLSENPTKLDIVAVDALCLSLEEFLTVVSDA